ncbi:MAG TPA: extracellular solute-binding protein, partial [Chloroflexota bacterium]|nr:extracellular solute-binding protein [Chloroflexota bacterium]
MSESSGERVAGSWTRRRLMGTGAALAAAGGGAALSACGPAGTQGGGEAANPSAQPVTVRFHSRGGAPGSQEVTLYDEQMPLFMQKHPNIKIVHEGFTGEDYAAKITVLSAGNSLGDVMWTAIGGGNIYYFAASKVIQPIEPYVAKEKFDLTQYYKNVIEGLKRDGKVYGLPFKSHPGVSVMFYNQTAYEKSGAVPDKTWTLDRLVDGAKRATQGDVFGYNPQFVQKS